jgi:hypothetical protein
VLAYDPADETALTRHVSGDEYIGVLLARQAAYLAAHPPRRPGLRPLLEWFVRDEDAAWVTLPADALEPGDNWPPLHHTWTSVVQAQTTHE